MGRPHGYSYSYPYLLPIQVEDGEEVLQRAELLSEPAMDEDVRVRVRVRARARARVRVRVRSSSASQRWMRTSPP